MTRTTGIRTYQPDDEAAVFDIMLRALKAGELVGETRHGIEQVRDRLALDPLSRFVALDAGVVAGFISPIHHMLIVHPTYRRRGHGTRLVEAALAAVRDTEHPSLELAVPAATPTAEPFARSLGFTYRSSLWLLRLDHAIPVPPPAFPNGYTTRFIEVGPDDERFVALFNRSFAEHPSPLQVTLAMIQHVHNLPDFDPTTIVLLLPPGMDEPAGFCRISQRDDSGDIEFIGVLPKYRGHGLGRELLRWGLSALRSRGARTIHLSVEADNEFALGLYERTGFQREQEWPRWALPPS
jgi:mycothiol synthase